MQEVPSRIKERWQADVGEITEDQWKRILKFGPLVSVFSFTKSFTFVIAT